MGGKSSSAPAPKPVDVVTVATNGKTSGSTPVQTPPAVATSDALEEQKKQQMTGLGGTKTRKDPASVVGPAPSSSMAQSAVLTG